MSIAIRDDAPDSPAWVTALDAARRAEQLVVIAGSGGSNAWISMHEKDREGCWRMILSTPGLIGREGLGKTEEGDGKTPVGVFCFNRAFGIAEDPGCVIPYVTVDDDAYWSGDFNVGYNQPVSFREHPELNIGASEHLVDHPREYRYCLSISYNEEGKAGAGSAIFLHCFGDRKPYTGGCAAIPEEQMRVLMQRVRADCVVVIDSMEALGAEF